MSAPATAVRQHTSSLAGPAYADSPVKPSATNHDTSADQNGAPQQDLWSSILNSVRSSKAISTKNIVLLGEPKSGKTALLLALASASPAGLVNGKSSYSASPPDDKPTASTSREATTPTNDLGLAYAYFDVGDEKDRDEIVARVGAYTLHSSQPAYTSLLPFAFPEPNLSSTEQDTAAAMSALASATLNPSASANGASSHMSAPSTPRASLDSLRDSIVVILLDWEQPWTFLEQLRNWLSIIHELIDGAAHGALSSDQQPDAKWSKTRVALDEMKERLEAYIRAYVEPAQKTSETVPPAVNGTSAPSYPSSRDVDASVPPITTVSVQLDGADANPLAEGMLTDNLGIPIVVVCTKADAIARLERDQRFKEEQFDYIQQVLRTICMKYGAALFYTSSTRAQSIDILRSYLLHRLFTPSVTQQQQSSGAGSGNVGATGGVASFNFKYRASTTDRDTLLVPAGWDSWGKIKALREAFDTRSMARGWENDCAIESLRRSRKLPRTKEVEDELEKEMQADRRGDGADQVQSAIQLYEDIVSDWQAGPVGKEATTRVRIPDEQAFLGQHHAALQKEPEAPTKASKRGVVGPMTGDRDGLPSVERYMSSKASETGVERPKLDVASRRESTSAAAAAAVAAMTGGDRERNSRPSSPAVASASGATSPGAPKQSEVLHSFFQSLLKDKGSGVGSPKAADRIRSSAAATAAAATSTSSVVKRDAAANK